MSKSYDPMSFEHWDRVRNVLMAPEPPEPPGAGRLTSRHLLPYDPMRAQDWHQSVIHELQKPLPRGVEQYQTPLLQEEKWRDNIKRALRDAPLQRMLLADIGKIEGARPAGFKSKLNIILPPMPGGPRGTLGESVGGLTRIQGPGGGSVMLSREELGQPADPNYTVSVTGLFGGRGRGSSRGRGRGRGGHSGRGGSRGYRFRFSRSRKRVSRKRVSRKRVSRKRVSRKRVSRKRVSRKRL